MSIVFLSKLLVPFLKEDPKHAAVVSHKLMLRSGMIKQISAGLYTFLPLGKIVLDNILNIVKQEMYLSCASEIVMPSIQPIELWQKSGRYGATGDLGSEMLIIHDRHGNKMTFSPTAEEVVVDLFSKSVQSYKSLPMNLYQITWKFRDEIRPRFGLMRAREFLMKDAYSFDIDEESANVAYKTMFIAYLKIFKRLGLSCIPVKADTGDMGGDLSHEFHILANSGESTIYYEKGLSEYLASEDFRFEEFNKFYAQEDQKHNQDDNNLVDKEILWQKSIEIGHIFYLGDKYTKSLDCKVQNRDGKFVHPKMGCYGIGISRLMAGLIEANYDEHGIIWPSNIAPFDVVVSNLKISDSVCDSFFAEIASKLSAKGLSVLLDDEVASIGDKISRGRLIGVPWIVNIGPKSASKGLVEVISRRDLKMIEVSIDSAVDMINNANLG